MILPGYPKPIVKRGQARGRRFRAFGGAEYSPAASLTESGFDFRAFISSGVRSVTSAMRVISRPLASIRRASSARPAARPAARPSSFHFLVHSITVSDNMASTSRRSLNSGTFMPGARPGRNVRENQTAKSRRRRIWDGAFSHRNNSRSKALTSLIGSSIFRTQNSTRPFLCQVPLFPELGGQIVRFSYFGP